jgi:predicted RNA binding protein YcfA (HicA-like mRNA interferase family)
MPTITAKLVIEFLDFHGFIQSGQSGSHKFFRHPDIRIVTILDHTGEDLG